MNQCKNLDEFHDLIFYVDDTLIKANSLILVTRCEYFRNMLSSQYGFSEFYVTNQIDNDGVISISGVPKQYFTCII